MSARRAPRHPAPAVPAAAGAPGGDPPYSIRDRRRAEVLDAMAAHVLREGLAGASLRPLAAAAGTSDRMLLYYFADKDDLLAAVLGRIAAGLVADIESRLALGDAPVAPPVLFAALRTALRTPALRPAMQLWVELAVRAARGDEPHRTIAHDIAAGFLAWTAARVRPARGADPRVAAAQLLALLDGCILLEMSGHRAAADAAATLLAPP